MNQSQISAFLQTISSNSKEIDVYNHIKQSIRNLETDCNCSQPNNLKLYCVPCKTLVCYQCNLDIHQAHNLANTHLYELNPEKINHLFNKYTQAIENNELINSYEIQIELIKKKINDSFNKFIDEIEKYRKIKLNEMQKLTNSLKTSITNFHSKLNSVKSNLTNFYNKNSQFFDIPNNNDETNIIFLINYDIVSNTNIQYDIIKSIFDNLSFDFNSYTENLSKEFEQIQTSIHEILYKDSESINKQKFAIFKDFTKKNDENILIENRNEHPDLYFEFNCTKLNTDLFKSINQRIDLFDKQINKTKNNVYTSYLQHKNLKQIEQINTSYENSMKTGINSLFTNRKTLTKLNSFNSSISKNQFILNENSNKDDIQLNNITIQKHFSFLIMDIYLKHFKPQPKNIHSLHSQFLLKSEEDNDEIDDIISNTNNIARVIEDTNEISLYDKKKRTYSKKQLNLMKNPYGYTKFPIGCRSILIGDKLYISGGKAPKKMYANVLVYDIKNDHLKRISDLKCPRSCHTMAYIDVFNTLIIIGGEQCNSVEVFDAVSLKWVELPSLNYARANPFFYLNKPQGMLYAMYGIEGKITSNVYSDVVEVLDLANVKKGWKVLNVKNNLGTSLKIHLCVFPIKLKDKILVYGCMKKRKLNKMVFVFDMGKNEYVNIDQTIYDELAEEAKTNKTLSYIVSTIHLNK